MKRNILISFVLAGTLGMSAFCASNNAHAEGYSSVNVSIDGTVQSFEQSALNIDGTTMVPMRPIFEKLGATVEWQQTTQTVTATKGDRTIKLTIGSKTAYVNNQARQLPAAPQLINNNTLIPLRFVSEALDNSVSWDGNTSTVYIRSDGYTDREKEINDFFGTDIIGATKDTVWDYWAALAEQEAKNEADKEKREAAMTDAFVEIMYSGVSNEELSQGWMAIPLEDREAIWWKMTYDQRLELYQFIPTDERARLFVIMPIDDIDNFFNDLSIELQDDTFYAIPYSWQKFVFIQLRLIDESKPMELWWRLPLDNRKDFYNKLPNETKEWVREQLTDEQWKEFESYDNSNMKG